MGKTVLATKFFKMALVYFVIGVTMGAIMSIKPVHDFVILSSLISGAHTHVNLLGWVSLALIGAVYSLLPENKPVYSEKLGRISFLLLNIGVAAMFILLLIAGYIGASMTKAGNYAGIDAVTEPYMILIMVSGMVVALGVYTFAYNIFKTLS